MGCLYPTAIPLLRMLDLDDGMHDAGLLLVLVKLSVRYWLLHCALPLPAP